MGDSFDLKNITKFNGTNFQLWKFQMLAVFEASGLKEVVEGTLARPAEASQTYAAWASKNAKAKCILASSMEFSQLEYLITCQTANEMWRKLSSIYEQRSAANKSILLSRFYEYKMGTNDTVMQHVAKVENLARQLNEVGEVLSDVAINTKIMMTLPGKFNPLITAWDSVAAENQTRANLIERLIKEEQRLTIMDETAEALAATNIGKKNIKRNDKKSDSPNLNNVKIKKDIECYFCHKRGHYARECRKRKSSRKTERDNTGYLNQRSSEREVSPDKYGAFVITNSNIEENVLKSDIQNAWLLDSGASKHMSFQKHWFSKLNETNETVCLGDNSMCEVKGRGTIYIQKYVNGKWIDGRIDDVLYVPDLKRNLFSIGVITQKGFNLRLTSENALIYSGNDLIAYGKREKNNLYRIMFKVITKYEANVTVKNDLSLWHQRLAHINCKALRDMINKNLVTGIKLESNNTFFCECCILGKQHKLPFNKIAQTRKSKAGELIHADLCGPMPTDSVGGSKYFLLLKDDYSCYRTVFFLRHKSDTFERFKEFENAFYTKFEYRMKALRCDNGTEFCNKQLKEYLASRGIKLETSAPYVHQQNGRAEREMRTIVECARTMILAKNLSQRLWAEAVNTAVYILNRCVSSISNEKTPFELWTRQKPDLAHIRIFGSIAYAHIVKEFRKKFDAKSKKCIFVGYQGDSKNYRLYDLTSDRVITSRDVIFNETIDNVKSELDIRPTITIKNETIMNSENIVSDDEDTDESEAIRSVQQSHGEKTPIKYGLRDRVTIKTPSRYTACLVSYVEPKTYTEAMQSEDSIKWKFAINEELKAHEKNETWELTPLPANKKAIGCKWVFKIKEDPSINEIRYKARLCAKGYSQKEGFDYNEVFSPVVRYDSVRILLAIAAQENLEIGQFDVKTAFINGKLREEIYMQLPDGLKVRDKDVVCKLRKSLYGLKQSARCWNERFDTFLKQIEFCQSSADPCVYFHENKTGRIMIALYVDDGLILATDKNLLNDILKNICDVFEITIGNSEYFLGMQVKRNREENSIFINQRLYIERMLARFNMIDATPLSIPADPHVKLQAASVEDTIKSTVPYREAVGTLLFLSLVSRPDIAYAVGIVSRYLDRYNNLHWNAVKRIMRYLSHTKNHGILYSKCENLNLIGFSDSDYAADIDTRRSTSGYIFKLSNGPITWTSKRQTVVSLSTAEAEYIAACLTVKDSIWIRKLLSELGHSCGSSTPIYIDNQSTIKLVRNPEFHSRTKHIDVKFHFIREKYDNHEINVLYVCTRNQIADLFTKALPKEKFENLRCEMGLLDVDI